MSIKSLAVRLVAVGLFIFTSLECVIVPMVPTYLQARSLPSWASFPLFACKPFAQLVAGPLIAGYAERSPIVPLAVGFVILIVSAFLVGADLSAALPTSAAWTSYGMLCAARLLLGVGSAAVMSGGMGIISQLHSDAERGTASGNAMSGLALGALAPLWGGWSAEGVDAVAAIPFWIFGSMAVAALAAVPHLRAGMRSSSLLDQPSLLLSTCSVPPLDASLPPTSSPSSTPSSTPTPQPTEPSLHGPTSTAPDSSLPQASIPWGRFVCSAPVLLVAGSIALANCAASLTEPLVPLWLDGPPLKWHTGLQVGSLAVGSPAVGSPAVGSPVVGSPAVGSLAVGCDCVRDVAGWVDLGGSGCCA